MMDLRIKTIMVVDDERPVLEVLRHFLEAEGYCVLAMDHGRSAIELSRRLPVDLLLADVFLPSHTARELANRIASNHPKVKALFMSGYCEEVVTSHGLLPLGSEILQKPVARLELVRRVKASLSAGTYWKQIATGSGFGQRLVPGKAWGARQDGWE